MPYTKEHTEKIRLKFIEAGGDPRISPDAALADEVRQPTYCHP